MAHIGAVALPELRRMPRERLQRILDEAGPLILEYPLEHRLSAAEKKKLVVPSWAPRPLTGATVMALAVFGLYVWMGEDADLCEQLRRDWPIQEGLALAGLVEQQV